MNDEAPTEELEAQLKEARVKLQEIREAVKTFETMLVQHWQYVLALEVELSKRRLKEDSAKKPHNQTRDRHLSRFPPNS